jgi:hypothetical protein
MWNIEVPHDQFRSQSGEDAEENLITLGSKSHAAAHGRKVC